MGAHGITYAFIGRRCTQDEIDLLWPRAAQLMDDWDWENLLTLTMFGEGKTALKLDNLPVVLHVFSLRYDAEDLSSANKDDIQWFVVQHFICESSFYPGDKMSIEYTEWPQPKDDRYGLLLVHDIR